MLLLWAWVRVVAMAILLDGAMFLFPLCCGTVLCSVLPTVLCCHELQLLSPEQTPGASSAALFAPGHAVTISVPGLPFLDHPTYPPTHSLTQSTTLALNEAPNAPPECNAAQRPSTRRSLILTSFPEIGLCSLVMP